MDANLCTMEEGYSMNKKIDILRGSQTNEIFANQVLT
jgi:hypothetical protein